MSGEGWGVEPLRGRARALGPSIASVHSAVLGWFARLGCAPDLQALATHLGIPGEDLLEATRRLQESDLIQVDWAAGRIASAYPFSGTPTLHQVFPDGGPPLYAMCAIDALGIPSLLGRRASVVSRCSQDGTPVGVVVSPEGAESWNPEGAVVSIAPSGTRAAAESLCPGINFLCTRGHATEGQTILDIPSAAAMGVYLFGEA